MIGKSGNLLDMRDELPCKVKTSRPDTGELYPESKSAEGEQAHFILWRTKGYDY